VKPNLLTLSLSLAVALGAGAQTNPAPTPAAQANQEQPPATATKAARPSGPMAIVQDRLKQLEVDAPVSYHTNGNLVFCTVACRDVDQRNAVYDGFSNLAKYGLTATRNPPTVTVVLLLDAARYLSEQQNQKLVSKLQSVQTNLVGQVLQKTPDGLFVALGDSQLALLTDAPNLSDGDPVKVTAFRIGAYEFTDKSGTRKVLPKFTGDMAVATDHWTPLAASEAKAETQKRTDASQ